MVPPSSPSGLTAAVCLQSMGTKTIKRRHPAYRDDIADLTTRRPVPGPDVEQIDPFLFLNHHGPQVYAPRNRGLPFGPHPHRGFETVTFILTGELAHRDSAGHESIIKEGGIQWMTAGSGLVHAEISPEDFMQRGRTARDTAALGQPAAEPEDDSAAVHRAATRRDSGIAHARRQRHREPHLRRLERPRRRDAAVARHLHVDGRAYGVRARFRFRRGWPQRFPLRRSRHGEDRGEQAPQYHLIELSDDGDSVEIERGNRCRAVVRSCRADRRARRGLRTVRHEHARRDFSSDPRLPGRQVQRGADVKARFALSWPARSAARRCL